MVKLAIVCGLTALVLTNDIVFDYTKNTASVVSYKVYQYTTEDVIRVKHCVKDQEKMLNNIKKELDVNSAILLKSVEFDSN